MLEDLKGLLANMPPLNATHFPEWAGKYAEALEKATAEERALLNKSLNK